tara:strand:+ start:1534 stop:1917 length:384 start_codon:yes stop_codon:yes gene_type:complete
VTARYDWTINQGETSELLVKRANASGAFDGTTAYVANFRMQAKDKYGGTTVLNVSGSSVFTSPHDNTGSNSSDEDNATVKVVLSSTDTAAIAAGKYVYDIENFDGSTPPIVTRILEGSLIVTPEVTT